MSAELDRLYERLAERADAVPLAGLGDIRARARHRRNRTIVTAAIAVVAVVAAIMPWLARSTPPPVIQPDVPPPITFTPFDPDAKPVVAFDKPAELGIALASDTHAYVMWLDEDNSEHVAVIDLATRRPVFAPVNVGRFGDTNGMQVARDAIVLLAEQGFGETGGPVRPDTIIALDPGTGRELWRLPYSYNDTDRVLFPDLLVLTWISDGRTEAIDLKTGAVRWTFDEPAVKGGTTAIRAPQESEVVSASDDRRVVVHTRSGRLKVLDVDSGRVLSERDGPATGPTGYGFVLDGKLYAASEKEVREIDVFGTAPLRLIHTTAKATRAITPCATRLICVVADDRVAAVDPVSAKVVWEHTVFEFRWSPVPYGPNLLVLGSQGPVILGPAGQALAEPKLQGTLATWIDGGNLLLWSADSGVSGLSLATGAVTKLGENALVAGLLAVAGNMVIMPTPEGIFVHRFA
ncbi:PQQ-binding-like beta-propeller repeat protein [Allorhizocola rhizosphaerae]|uniref:outer membrane protein assembly factor BamB family protein n=1 Tax=Allorhizocola rhizosphaerae TaxID=1872709 RepID=UPI000E3DBE55|nr:PQQ-binding-like beta-propeller repeat protein [Allorhizocola rhizosphaerae]